jgi:acyl-CoA thioester hydrolase
VIDVDGAVERVRRTSVVMTFAVSVGERLCCRVRTTYVFTDLEGSPTPVPDDLRALWS